MQYFVRSNQERPADKLLLRIVFLLYIIVGIAGVLHHEPWRDEAQSWLVSQQTDLFSLLKKLPSEGHPPLWYFILMPFAHAGAPYITQNFLSLAIAAAGVGILLFRTRLPVIIRILFALSYSLWYQYAVIARNYCLVVFFLMLIVALYTARFRRPWAYALAIIGLFNSHILMFSFAFGLVLLFGVEAGQQTDKKKLYGAFILMLAGGIYLLPYLAATGLHSPHGLNIRDHVSPLIHAWNAAIFVSYELTIVSCVWLVLLIIVLRKTRQLLFLLLTGCAGPCIIFAFKYTGFIWHHALLWIIIVAVTALIPFYSSDDRQQNFRAKLLWCLFLPVMSYHCYVAARVYIKDYREPYSGGKSAASFLSHHHLLSGLLIAQNNKAISILPYLPPGTKFYHPDCQRSISYVIYDSCEFYSRSSISPDSMMMAAMQQLPLIDTNTIFISDAPVAPSVLSQNWQLLYQTPGKSFVGMEDYFVYRYSRERKSKLLQKQ